MLRLTRSAWLQLLAAVGILLVAFALRIHGLHAADLTFDEVATVFVARRPIGEVVSYVMSAAREHPPVYYLGMSLWMERVGASELAVRYPSALMGLLAVAWSFRLGHRLFGKQGGWWALVLIGAAPFSIWASRNGRMYALVLLLSLMVMDSWLQWRAQPNRRNWLIFTGLSLAAAMTHFYLVLLWPAQAILLLLHPRETRAIRRSWLTTLAGIGLIFGLFVAISPGIRAMVLEVARRFPVWETRNDELRILTTSLYLGWFRPELAWTGALGLGLTTAGWAVTWRHYRLGGTLLAVWSLTPLLLLHLVPERLESRYLMPIFPALVLSIAALLAAVRTWPLHLAAAVSVLWFSAWRLPTFYEAPDSSFSTRMRTLHIAASSEDALVMNGPWPSLLLTYYEPPTDLAVYAVPEAAPPGFDAAVDIPRLETILNNHSRLWVSYGAIQWADPQYSVSRWLAENTHCVFEQEGMVLCLRPPDAMTVTSNGLPLGPRLTLVEARVNRQSAQAGDGLGLTLKLDGQDLDRSIVLALALLDKSGQRWLEREFHLGPVHRPAGSQLPTPWHERSGLWLLPGIPPGDYTLGLRVYGDGIDMDEAADFHGWISLGTIEMLDAVCHAELVQLLPNHEQVASIHLGDQLRIVGVEAYAEQLMQGYPAGFHLWWQALDANTTGSAGAADSLDVRLIGPSSPFIGSFPLGPDFYPASAWQAGDVVRQQVFFDLPDTLPPGPYQVQVRAQTSTGTVLSPAPGTPDAQGDWSPLFALNVEARRRHYRPPLLLNRQAVRFGDVLELRGFRLTSARPQSGDTLRLTTYWQALQRPQQTYAVFNHLRATDNTVVWQADSWPQAGVYTTDRWLEGEVVAESYTLELPADLAPGSYTLYTGVYDPLSGDRLPAVDREGRRLQNDELPLHEFVVTR